MRIDYTAYAEMKTAKREIARSKIEKTLKNPDKILDGKYGRKIAQKKIGKYVARVVFEEHGNTYKVITAYYSSPERYR